jgi:hypothetical protein
MDRFSIYELLSYIVPGYVAAKILEYYLQLYDVTFPIPIDGTLDNNLLLLVVAIVLGVAVHVLTFKLMSFNWFKKLMYQKESHYIKNNKDGTLQRIMPAVTDFYISDKKHDDTISEIKFLDDTTFEYNDLTFDLAYYYLEVKDKVTQAKNFQSFYFLFRNLFTISLTHFLALLVLWIFGLLKWSQVNINNWNTLIMVAVLLLFTVLIVIIAQWLRGKMIDRVLWSYYVDRQIDKIDNLKK